MNDVSKVGVIGGGVDGLRYRRGLRLGGPPLLLRMTAAGLLGRKSGRGFYDCQEKR